MSDKHPVTPEMLDAGAGAREVWLRFQDDLLDRITRLERQLEEARQTIARDRAKAAASLTAAEAAAEGWLATYETTRDERDAAEAAAEEARRQNAQNAAEADRLAKLTIELNEALAEAERR